MSQTTDGQVIWHDSQILPQIDPLVFDPEWHHAQGNVLGSAIGRGQAQFLRFKGLDLVLRPFRRGGLMGRINPNRYLRMGATRSRAYREFDLLTWMRAQELPVPRPVAARYVPHGLWYRADLITQSIPQAQPLADVVQNKVVSPKTWNRIGGVIRQMHRLGVDHTDLNCRNILLDGDHQVWLIDFDKCRRRAAGNWAQHNLDRLKRSLEKEQGKHPALFWSQADWAALQQGYKDG